MNGPGTAGINEPKTERCEWFLSAARAFAFLLVCALSVFLSGVRSARASEPAQIHWTTVTQAQVKIDQTTPLTWAVYQPGKGDKLDKKLSNLVLVLAGHRYLLIDLKSKQVYEIPLKQVRVQGEECETNDLAESSILIPTSDWTWRNVGPAELYHLTMGDYGLALQLTLPHPYLISPYY